MRRRKWLFLTALVAVPAAAIAYSLYQSPEYSASSDVLLGRQSSLSSITGTPDLSSLPDPQRIVDTETALAREPQIASRVLASSRLKDRTARDLLDHLSVSAATGTNLLTFRVTDRHPEVAERLANTYSKEFSSFVVERDTSAMRIALRRIQKRISQLGPRGNSTLLGQLTSTEEQLQTQLALQTANASVVRTADNADQVQPRPVRNGLLGLALGVVLAFGLVFLRDALDTKVKTTEEARSILHLPLLARIPRPPRQQRGRFQLAMLSDPSGPQSEPFRVLRTNLEFTNMGGDVRTILVTSALEQEGKSTTASNLAIGFALQGKDVVLVDLDLRRPSVHRYFGIEATPGLTGVALGHVPLTGALVPFALGNSQGTPPRPTSGAVRVVSAPGAYEAAEEEADPWLAPPEEPGERAPEPVEHKAHQNGGRKAYSMSALSVLPAGPIPPDPGEFVSSTAVRTILDTLSGRADLVIVDSPPVLTVGDALALSSMVDGIVVVTRLDLIHRRTLAELHRVLESTPTKKLGFVVTGSDAHDDYGYGYGYGHYGSAGRGAS